MTAVELTPWHKVKTPPVLLPGSVHLWRFPLHGELSLSDILSNDEKQRAQRLRVPEKAQAFVVARTRLRQILGSYLDVSPEKLLFDYNEHGKPSLTGDISFNLSHSGHWGVCAVTRCGDVGVDVEAVKQSLDVAPLAERFFSAAENQWFNAVSSARRQRSFYRLWTRKEAWLKGKGGGFSELHLGLDDVHLSNLFSSAQGWRLMNMPIAKGYVGALAVKGDVARVERFTFEGSCKAVGL